MSNLSEIADLQEEEIKTINTIKYIETEYQYDEIDEVAINCEKQVEIEEKMTDLYWDIKEYTDEKLIPICETLTIEHLIEFLHPKMKRVIE